MTWCYDESSVLVVMNHYRHCSPHVLNQIWSNISRPSFEELPWCAKDLSSRVQSLAVKPPFNWAICHDINNLFSHSQAPYSRTSSLRWEMWHASIFFPFPQMVYCVLLLVRFPAIITMPSLPLQPTYSHARTIRNVNDKLSNYHWIYVVVNSAIRKPAQIIDIELEILFRE